MRGGVLCLSVPSHSNANPYDSSGFSHQLRFLQLVPGLAAYRVDICSFKKNASSEYVAACCFQCFFVAIHYLVHRVNIIARSNTKRLNKYAELHNPKGIFAGNLLPQLASSTPTLRCSPVKLLRLMIDALPCFLRHHRNAWHSVTSASEFPTHKTHTILEPVLIKLNDCIREIAKFSKSIFPNLQEPFVPCFFFLPRHVHLGHLTHQPELGSS